MKPSERRARELKIAREVRDAHADGKTCPECPTEPGQRRCQRLATWFELFAELDNGDDHAP